jgi:hypothetical protein
LVNILLTLAESLISSLDLLRDLAITVEILLVVWIRLFIPFASFAAVLERALERI